MQPLPTTLEREPLVDAAFELRLRGVPPLADIRAFVTGLEVGLEKLKQTNK